MADFDMQAIDIVGYLAASIVFLTFCMKTMVTLRIAAIASNLAFIVYALVEGLWPILILHGSLLPLNLFRFVQMKMLISQADAAVRSDGGPDHFSWLIPMGKKRKLSAGAVLFKKGDLADRLFIVTNGSLIIPEYGITIGPGSMIGEIGLFTGESRRTAGAKALEAVELAELTQKRIQELYFDNPKFAYRLVRLITQRLLGNIQRLENTAPVAQPMDTDLSKKSPKTIAT